METLLCAKYGSSLQTASTLVYLINIKLNICLLLKQYCESKFRIVEVGRTSMAFGVDSSNVETDFAQKKHVLLMILNEVL